MEKSRLLAGSAWVRPQRPRRRPPWPPGALSILSHFYAVCQPLSPNSLKAYMVPVVVYHCDTTPTLYQVPDPFGRLLARQTGAVRIKSSDVIAASESLPASTS